MSFCFVHRIILTEMDGIVLISIVSAIFLGTLTKSTFGFGDALIAMPILTMLVDLQTAAPIVVAVSVLTSFKILFFSIIQTMIYHFFTESLSSGCG